MKRLVLAVALMLGVSSPAFAADDDGKFFGRGTISCAKWLDGKTDNARKTANLWWLQGLMTGMNKWVKGKADWLDHGEIEGVLLLFNQYCEKNPLHYSFQAVRELEIQTGVRDRNGKIFKR